MGFIRNEVRDVSRNDAPEHRLTDGPSGCSIPRSSTSMPKRDAISLRSSGSPSTVPKKRSSPSAISQEAMPLSAGTVRPSRNILATMPLSSLPLLSLLR